MFFRQLRAFSIAGPMLIIALTSTKWTINLAS